MTFQPPILESLTTPFPQPASVEEPIIEVLKYSQKDMDAALARVQAEVCPALREMQELVISSSKLSLQSLFFPIFVKVVQKEEHWSAKYKKLSDDGQEMRWTFQ